MPLSVSIKHTRPSFGQQDNNSKQTSVRDLCCSESGYLMPGRDNSYVRHLG